MKSIPKSSRMLSSYIGFMMEKSTTSPCLTPKMEEFACVVNCDAVLKNNHSRLKEPRVHSLLMFILLPMQGCSRPPVRLQRVSRRISQAEIFGGICWWPCPRCFILSTLCDWVRVDLVIDAIVARKDQSASAVTEAACGVRS